MAANLAMFVFAAFFVHFVVYLVYLYFWRLKSIASIKGEKVLIVTAHPDDECMFFGPSILQLARSRYVRLLCLSNGDFYGLGRIREKELVSSCSLLGIPAKQVTLLNKNELKDGQDASWDPGIVSTAVYEESIKHNIELVITFDGHGVSGHSNHISIYHGVKKMLQDKRKSTPKVYLLESTSISRKYISLFDMAYSIFAKHVFVATFQDFRILQKAMEAHQSQMVWFRRLYITFSRYMFINTLQSCS